MTNFQIFPFHSLPDILPKLDPNLVRMVQSVGNSDSIKARAAISELSEILESPEKQAILRDYEELYVDSICTQFKVHNKDTSLEKPKLGNISVFLYKTFQHLSQIPLTEALVMYQPLLSSVFAFYTSRSLGKNVSSEQLKKLMAILIGLMADQKFPNNDEGQHIKVINGICLKILNKSHFTQMSCALIRLLRETCSGASLPKFTDLLMKCIWRNVKVMPEKTNELDYDLILFEVHEFMAALPSTWWQQRHSDTPYRTVKTIVHNMATIKGNAILQHLNKIPTHSEVYAYLIKVLKNLQKDNPSAANTPGKLSGNKRVSLQTHEAMQSIFTLISNKETGRDGLEKLHEFKVS